MLNGLKVLVASHLLELFVDHYSVIKKIQASAQPRSTAFRSANEALAMAWMIFTHGVYKEDKPHCHTFMDILL